MKNIKKFNSYFESEEVTKSEPVSDTENLQQDFTETLSIVSEMSKIFYELYRLELLDEDQKILDHELSDVNEVVAGLLEEESDYFESEEDIKVKYDKFIESMKFLTDNSTEVNEGLFDKFKKAPLTDEDIMSYINKHPGRRKAYGSFDDTKKAAYLQFFKENPSLVRNNEIALVKWDEEVKKFVKAGVAGQGPGLALV